MSVLIGYFFLLCSQSLINLLLTGHAVSNVWDGDRECSGMSKLIMLVHNFFYTMRCSPTHLEYHVFLLWFLLVSVLWFKQTCNENKTYLHKITDVDISDCQLQTEMVRYLMTWIMEWHAVSASHEDMLVDWRQATIQGDFIRLDKWAVGNLMKFIQGRWNKPVHKH